jgi:hypothetical protein
MTISAAARCDLQGWQEYIEMYVSSLHADDPTKTCVNGLNPNSFMSFPRCVNQKLNNKAVNNVVNLLPTDILERCDCGVKEP